MVPRMTETSGESARDRVALHSMGVTMVLKLRRGLICQWRVRHLPRCYKWIGEQEVEEKRVSTIGCPNLSILFLVHWHVKQHAV